MQGQGKCAWIETNEDSGEKEDVFNDVEWTESSDQGVNRKIWNRGTQHSKFQMNPMRCGGDIVVRV